MQEIEVQFSERLVGAQLLDPRQATSLVSPEDEARAKKESLRPGGPAAQLDDLRGELDDLRRQLEQRRQQPDPAATAAVLQRENELRVELERTRASRQALEGLLKSISQMAGQLRQEPERLKIELQDAAVHLGELIASKLLHEKISSGDYRIEEFIKTVVDRLNSKDPITVLMHPTDLAMLKERLGDDSLLPNGPDLTYQPDPSLPRGNCRATTGDINVAYILREQLNLTMAQLREVSCWDST
jgi:flagellar biosynthesis/type III secretory pathway protein FliH